MWILVNHQNEILQKVIDYVWSLEKSNTHFEPTDAQEIRHQIRGEDFKHHLSLGMEYGETFEPLSIDIESVYKFYHRLRESNLPPQKQAISTKQIESICNNLKIGIPATEVKNCSDFSDYIIDQILKLDDGELISSWLIKNQSFSLILAEILDIIKLLELLARQKAEEINRLLTGWEINIDDIKDKFAKEISFLQKELV